MAGTPVNIERFEITPPLRLISISARAGEVLPIKRRPYIGFARPIRLSKA